MSSDLSLFTLCRDANKHPHAFNTNTPKKTQISWLTAKHKTCMQTTCRTFADCWVFRLLVEPALRDISTLATSLSAKSFDFCVKCIQTPLHSFAFGSFPPPVYYFLPFWLNPEGGGRDTHPWPTRGRSLTGKTRIHTQFTMHDVHIQYVPEFVSAQHSEIIRFKIN